MKNRCAPDAEGPCFHGKPDFLDIERIEKKQREAEK